MAAGKDLWGHVSPGANSSLGPCLKLVLRSHASFVNVPQQAPRPPQWQLWVRHFWMTKCSQPLQGDLSKALR